MKYSLQLFSLQQLLVYTVHMHLICQPALGSDGEVIIMLDRLDTTHVCSKHVFLRGGINLHDCCFGVCCNNCYKWMECSCYAELLALSLQQVSQHLATFILCMPFDECSTKEARKQHLLEPTEQGNMNIIHAFMYVQNHNLYRGCSVASTLLLIPT